MKLTAETLIAADRETVWHFTQTPQCHVKWDLRFSDIDYLPRGSADEPQRFRYATRLGGGLAIQGWGEAIGHPDRATSALRFGSADVKSLIREGAGSWTYAGNDGTTRFSTVYDYSTRYGLFGRALDLAFRPLMTWATRWSFDRLRLWIEDGVRPGIALRLWLLKVVVRSALAVTWIYEGLIPKVLAQRADEIALVRDSRLYGGTPSHTLAALGLGEIAFGFWLLSGRAEKVAATVSTAGICALAAVVVSTHPAALTDPLGGISKNLGLLGCGAVIWMLSEYSPVASRARPVRCGKPGRGTLCTLSPGYSRTDSPLAQALSADDLRRLAPLVRAHLTPAMGVHRYQGVMHSVWRVGGLRRSFTAPFLSAGSWMSTLFPETGKKIPFEIVNRLFPGEDGSARMTFERAFRFPGVDRRFEATMRYDAGSGAILDVLGRRRHLLVELVPTVEGAAVMLRSRRQWLTPFGLPLRLPLPRVLAGEATIREWQQDETSLGIRVTISNPLFGPFFGYEGTFRGVDDPTLGFGSVARASAVRGSQVARCLFVCLGTLAYAASFAVATTSGPARGASVRVATAAALSWPLFGLVLLVSQPRAEISRRVREWAGRWGDVCLRTMMRGMVPLGAAVALNLSLAAARIGGARFERTAFIPTHVGLLVASDLMMATYFIREATRLGMRSRVAVTLWLGVLNGAFALLLILL